MAQAESAQGYRDALKATLITGSAQVIVLLSRLVKTKVIAVLLGPAGMGVFGVLSSLMSTIQAFSDLGLRSSGVRQVAELSGRNDAGDMARTVKAIRRAMYALGLIVACLAVLFRERLAVAAFGSTSESHWIVIIAGAVFLASINDSQRILLRGMRRIADLAKADIFAGVIGAAVTVPLVWWLAMEGAAWAITAAMAISVLACGFYARRIRLGKQHLPMVQTWDVLRKTIRLGLVFTIVGIAVAGSAFAMRSILVHEVGLEGAGQFQAAATLSIVYVGFILQAMGQDFYPKLTAVQREPAEFNRVVNEQVELSVTLAAPGMVFTIALAPFLTHLLYSAEFSVAAEILRWQCVGVVLRVALQPLVYVPMARGDARTILATELFVNSLHVAALWFIVRQWGLSAIGVATPVAYALYALLLYALLRRTVRLRLSAGAIIAALSALAACIFVIFLLSVAGGSSGVSAAVLFACVTAVLSYRKVVSLTGVRPLPAIVARLSSTWKPLG